MENQTALVVNGEAVGLRDLLHGMKVRHGPQFLEDAIRETLIRQAARGKVSVSDQELQEAADSFRRSVGLYDVEATNSWLAGNGLTVEDFEEKLEGDLVAHQLRESLAEGEVEKFFAANRASLDRAIVSQILAGEEELAAELLAQIAEEGADFATVAGEHSQDADSRGHGGFLGPVTRAALGAEAEALVFGASAGQVVGPVKTERGWVVFKVHALAPAELDERTGEQIKDAIFHQWLHEERGKAKVETPLLTSV